MKAALIAAARACGFDAVGIVRPDAIPDAKDRLQRFLAEGEHGDMDWLANGPERRSDPRLMWGDVRSIVMLGLNYGPDDDPLALLTRRERGAISVYARGDDYHELVKAKLKQVARWLIALAGGDVKVFVDTAAVMEKPLAAAAGLGWQGKHTNLVSREFGSWLFLGAIFTTLDLPADVPRDDSCGSCSACLDICPTAAFPAPYRLDARRCISYLTIEHKGPIPRELRPLMGNRIYGCDDCLAVCPWNKFAQAGREAKLFARDTLRSPKLADLARLDDTAFRSLFAKTPVKRTGRDRFVRNVLIAIGNSGDASLAQEAERLLADASPLVRGAAVWALGRLDRAAVTRLAARRRAIESDRDVQDEWAAVVAVTAAATSASNSTSNDVLRTYASNEAAPITAASAEENHVTPIEFERPTVATNASLGWVSDVAADMLRRLGIRYVVQNPGSSFAGLHDSLVNYLGNQNPTMMLALNEQVAVALAHGYAKVTGEPLAVIMHSNVGLMNGIMGIYNAWVDRVPIYMIGASGPHDATLRTPWIHWIHTARDQAAMIRHFIKWDDSPGSAGAIMESMLRANILGRTQPCGPTYICLDVALQQKPLDGDIRLPDPARFAPPVAPEPPAAEIERAADLLVRAKNPVIMAGRVSRSQADWDRRVRLAELLGASVATDLKTAAAFPTDHKLHVGIPGVHFRLPQKEAVRNSDVVLALDWIDLGGILNFIYDGGEVAAKIVHCQVDSYVHNGWSMDHHGLAPADVPILADPDRCVERLLEAVEARLKGKSRWDGKARWQGPTVPRLEDRDPNAEIDLSAMTLALDAARKSHDIVLSRAPLGWMPEYYPLRGPLDYLGMDGGAGVGSGPGNAVGHALALMGTGKVAVSVIGDGDLMQGVTALWTAARYRIPAMIVVVNNRTHLNDELIQEKIARARSRPVENAWVGQRFSDPPLDIPGIARSHGVHAIGTVTRVGDLAATFEDALRIAEGGAPVLVDVLCETRVSASSHAEKGVETAGTGKS